VHDRYEESSRATRRSHHQNRRPETGLDVVSRVRLAHGNIAPGSTLLVELHRKNLPDAPASVLVSWPRLTEVSPAKFGEVVRAACRVLSNASTELARRRIVPEQP
jgi:hypothetical protein